MNVCDNLGDHLVGNVYIKVRKGGKEEPMGGYRLEEGSSVSVEVGTLSSALVHVPNLGVHCRTAFSIYTVSSFSLPSTHSPPPPSLLLLVPF